MQFDLWLLMLVPLGFLTGTYGSLVGVGGGFILVPVLLLLYPAEDPQVITSVSLAVVAVNALSASWAYARMQRIDYASGFPFALATIPGAVIGALTTALVPRLAFELIFGLFMIGASSFLLLKPAVQTERTGQNSAPGTPHSLRAEHLPLTPSHRMKGIGVSMGIGFLSSFLGIGGGILNVLMMLYLLEFPVHIATATSQFILAMTALVGAGTHVTTGELGEGIHQVIPLAIGVIVGAQMGARLSVRLHGAWIVRALALALGVAGLRFVLSVLMSA